MCSISFLLFVQKVETKYFFKKVLTNYEKNVIIFIEGKEKPKHQKGNIMIMVVDFRAVYTADNEVVNRRHRAKFTFEACHLLITSAKELAKFYIVLIAPFANLRRYKLESITLLNDDESYITSSAVVGDYITVE